MITLTLTQATAIILAAIIGVWIGILQARQQLNDIIENGVTASSEMQITDDDIRNIVDLILEELEKKKSHDNAEDSK